jgi:rSAM/selenodomain-associated transferase 1
MFRANPEVTVAVLAKAPVPGFAKTRLIPALGAHAAAFLQERLTEQAVATAREAALGRVVVWGAPDITHAALRTLAAKHQVRLARQPDGDLGARMFAAIADARGPALVIGTDCPALTPAHLRESAQALPSHDAVVIPAEDGGYVLIGMNHPHEVLFSGMTWSTDRVMAETRSRIARAGLTCHELPPLWDIDDPDDVDRMEREGFGDALMS